MVGIASGGRAGDFGGAPWPMNLLWVVVGCLLGTAAGVLPGLGSSMAAALLLIVPAFVVRRKMRAKTSLDT